MACKTCELCKTGRYNICKTLLFKSSAKTFPHADGTLAEYMNHPADLCHKYDYLPIQTIHSNFLTTNTRRIPENVTFEQAALVEPLSVSIHGVRRSDAPRGGCTLVFGAGAIGLLTAAVLQARGMSEVLVADIDEQRLQIALDLGMATKTFLIPRKSPKTEIKDTLADAQELAALLCAKVGVDGFDRVYECTGVPSCVQTGIYVSSQHRKTKHGTNNPRPRTQAERSFSSAWAQQFKRFR
jgi:L-iditol 2-dehydrogenase